MVAEHTTRPDFTPAEALQIAEAHFGISAVHADGLPSDRDQNFVVREKLSGRRYVLKVSHAEEDPEILDFQNRILEHLARAGFSLSKVLFSSDGRETAVVSGRGGTDFLARLLTWVPGTPLWRVNPQRPILMRSLGSFLGAMDRALVGFSHPAQDRPLKWDLQRAGEVVETHLAYVSDRKKRELLERSAKNFMDRLAPLVPDLRTGVIHSDANDHNILVSELGPDDDPDGRTVVGLLDFGDAVRSFIAGEVAIAGAYAMLGVGDPFLVASQIVSGYAEAFPLLEAEIEALVPLMGMRLCASVSISAHQKRREPDNSYLTVSEAPAWELLERMDADPLRLPTLLFREACGLDPIPSHERVVSWLDRHGKEASPIVNHLPEPLDAPQLREEAVGSLRDLPVHVFDLGTDSAEFPLPPRPEDAEGWTRLLFGRLESAGAVMGIGRYDEVRSWYASDLFRMVGDDPPEWRTVHLGIDLFLPPMSPVLSPFDAVVHSVANNAGTLDYGPTVILEHRVPAAENGDGGFRFWTLYGHLDESPALQLSPGRRLEKGERFARVGDFPGNGNWAPHLHFQIITDLLGSEGDFPGVAPPSQLALWKRLSPDPNLILGIPETGGDRSAVAPGQPDGRGTHATRPRPGNPSGAPLRSRRGRAKPEILAARQKHLGPTLSVSYKKPLKIVKGSGQFLFDEMGQTYLDCVNNVPHVGHSHPRVVDAGQRQMALLNTNTRYLHDLLVDYAERLVQTLPDPLSVVYFVCSGSEANELALRMARTHTGREDVLVLEGAYHGNTSNLVAMSPYKFDGPGGEGAPSWVHKIPMPDPYRGLYREKTVEEGIGPTVSKSGRGNAPEYLPKEALGPRYARHVQAAVRKLELEGRSPAAFFCEPLLGCGGQIVPPEGFLPEAFRYVRASGGVCVADEVQVGFGRVGTHFWAFAAQGVVPDMVTVGKPMANGHPTAAVITTPEIAGSFDTGMEYFNTFGGNPVSCAIGMAVLDVIESEGLQENARRVGEHLLHGLRRIKDSHPLVGDVRGLGLYIGVELVESRETREPATQKASRVKERLREHGILLSTDGPDDNVLKIKPPMVFTIPDAERLISTLDRILGEDGLQASDPDSTTDSSTYRHLGDLS